MMQHRAERNEIIRCIRRLLADHIELTNLQIVTSDSLHQIGADVAGNYMPGRSDMLCEPL
jgi:hypothetical protein